jgi:hypothetical protein
MSDLRQGMTELTASGSRLVMVMRFAAAAAGLALAIAAAELTLAPARPGQLPGYMSVHDLDAWGPMKTIVLATLLPFLCAVAAGPLIHRLVGARRWATLAAPAAWLASLALAVAGGGLLTVAGFTVIATGLVVTFRNRELPAGGSDAILLPAFVSLFPCLVLLMPNAGFAAIAAIAAILLFGMRAAFSPAAFTLAPLAVVPVALWPHSTAAAGAGLLIALATPFVLQRVGSPRSKQRLRILLTFAIFPLFSYSYAWIQRPIWYEEMPRVNLFEDGHSLMPASEMLRGELPYRDIVPGHGLVSDGWFDFVVARAAGDEAGVILGARERADNFLSVAIYFVGTAATGSPYVGAGGLILSTAIRAFWTPTEAAPTALQWSPALRSLPAVVALIFTVAAVRLRSARLLGGAAAATVLAAVVSVDFFAYSVVILGLALLLLMRSPQRRRMLGATGVGAAAAAIPIGATLALFGILGDFFVVTIREVLSLSSAYTIGFFQFPERFAEYQGVPEALALLMVPAGRWIVIWVLIALFTAAVFASRLREPLRRRDAFLFIGLLIVVEAVAYGERLNVHFMPLASAFTAIVLWKLLSRRDPVVRTAGAALLLVTIVVAGPTEHLRTLHRQLVSGPPDSASYVLIESIPRAEGALFKKQDAAAVETLRFFAERHLRGEATFFDFASMPIAYYLLDKDCPIRQYEVPFFQPPELQEEVIRRLEADPNVVAALISFPNIVLPIDGVPSEVRAPRVAAYLLENYRPGFSMNGLTMWRRIGDSSQVLHRTVGEP